MGMFKGRTGGLWLLAAALPVAGATGAAMLAWQFQIESIPLKDPIPPAPPDVMVIEGTIQKRSTLVETLVDSDLPSTLANQLAELVRPVFDLRKIRSGNSFKLERELDGALRTFEYRIDDERVLRIEKQAERYEAKVETLEFETQEAVVTAEITTSLFEALGDYPKGEFLALDLDQIFASDIDFNSDIQKGDQVRLVVTQQYHDGAFVKYGKILAAQLVNAGKTYRAFLFRDAYYDENGNATKRAFLKSPLEFTRISSRFTYRRMHPILGSARPHLAVDYAAPTGTPVRAVANGTVTFAGWSGGYGRLVQIRHASGLATGYAHLSSIAPGIRPGRAIKQGDRIGAVGATGLATGPHLHFMMTRGGKPINPLSIKSEPAPPIDVKLKPEFLSQIAARRDQLAGGVQFASGPLAGTAR